MLTSPALRRSYTAATATAIQPKAPPAHGQSVLSAATVAQVRRTAPTATPLSSQFRTQTGQVSPTVAPHTAPTGRSYSNTTGFKKYTTPISATSKPILVKSGWSNQGTVKNIQIIQPAQPLVPNLAHRVVRST